MSDGELPPGMAVIPQREGWIPWFRILVFCGIGFLLLLALVFLMGGAAALLITSTNGAPIVKFTIAVAIIAMAAFAGRYVTFWLLRKFREPERLRMLGRYPLGTPEHAWLLAQEVGREHWSRAKREEWVRLARSSGVNTWISKNSIDLLCASPRIEQPVEPEKVAKFGQQHESFMGTIAISLGIYNLAANYDKGLGGLGPGAVWLGMGVMLTARVALRGGLFSPVVAGQGWVQHGKARWSVADSVAEIRVGRWHKSVRVALVGPAGSTRLNYPLKPGRDQEFRDFWQRWAHPTPLLKQEAFVD